MNEQIKQMIADAQKDLDELDEKELQARIEMNDAHKAWEAVRIERELKIQRLRILTNQL